MRQILRFLVVGSSSVATDLGLYWLLPLWLGLSVSGAKAVSYLAGVLVGFMGNKFWTFASHRPSVAELLAYGVLYSLTLLLNTGCHALVLGILGPQGKVFAFLFATGITTVLNYLGMRYFIFGKGQPKERQTGEPFVPTVLRQEY